MLSKLDDQIMDGILEEKLDDGKKTKNINLSKKEIFEKRDSLLKRFIFLDNQFFLKLNNVKINLAKLFVLNIEFELSDFTYFQSIFKCDYFFVWKYFPQIKDFDLFIDFKFDYRTKKIFQQKRKEQFEKRLNFYIKRYIENSLKDENEKTIFDDDFFFLKKSEIKKIPGKPIIKRSKNYEIVQEIIKKKRNSKIKTLSVLTNFEEEIKKSSNQDGKYLKLIELRKNYIKEKEKLLPKIKMLKIENYYIERKKTIEELVNTIKWYFFTRKVKNVFLVSLLEYFFKTRFKKLDQNEIINLLVFLINLKIKWICLIENPIGKLLRLCNDFDVEIIFDCINKYFTKNN